MKRAIEESFPIVEINRLAVPERNAFKPIYHAQMVCPPRVLCLQGDSAEGSAWESLLESLCNAGFVIEAIYPIHGESESSLHLQDKQSISYDLIHGCKKRNGNGETKKRSWAGVRQEIRKRAREEIQMIEAGRYGNEKLSPADLNIILIGKCLELYSKHYGAIVDHNGGAAGSQRVF